MGLPTTVPVTEPNGRHGQYPLPPTFSERASPVYIDYRVKVVVRRGMFKVDQPLTLSFGYLPVAYPEAPSTLRRMAYNEGSLLIGPEGDPEGWKVCETVKEKGTLFAVRAVEVKCSLAIATPLCYAIGTPIPIEITLRSSDKQALDLLATPEALRVHLVRSMTTGSDAMDDDAPRRSNSHFLESVGDAYFWIQLESKLEGNLDGAPQEGGERGRLLRGEIEVQKTLKPSFKFPRFTMRYMIQMLPLKAPGFTLATSSDKAFVPEEPLISVPVTIVTRQAPGVKIRSYAPPGYEKRQGGDYNKSMGFMENGNQRFFHHLG